MGIIYNKRDSTLATTIINLSDDELTPVTAYQKLRDKFQNTFILELHTDDSQSNSIICCNPIATFKLENELIKFQFGNFDIESYSSRNLDIITELHSFIKIFRCSGESREDISPARRLYGFISYNGIDTLHKILIRSDSRIPDLQFSLYEFVLVFNSNKKNIKAYKNSVTDIPNRCISEFIQPLKQKSILHCPFKIMGEEIQHTTKDQFNDGFSKAIKHINRGDVFQIVISRDFSVKYTGDEFKIYRALREINPSPYMFYLDTGKFKILGCSPESQITVTNNIASLYPIAGTIKKEKEGKNDIVRNLEKNPKENAEHYMLVDLARNDLNTICDDVKVEKLKKIEEYSHVIHLTSKVSGRLTTGIESLRLLSNSFPAGTLSGAPKYRAIQLIDEIEKNPRGFYGGAIGYIDFSDDTQIQLNLGILIRTIFCINKELFYRAGAGIVLKSKLNRELNEITNKLQVIRDSLIQAEQYV